MNILRKNTENNPFLTYYDVIRYMDDVIMAETHVNVVTVNLITVHADISYCKCNEMCFY